MKHNRFILAAALCCLLLLGACTPAGGSAGQMSIDDQGGAQAGILSSFSATDLEGNPVDQSVLANYDLTMVNVWATFCGPCINEMPDLGEIAAEYADKGVQIIGLVTDVLDSNGSISDSQVDTARDIVNQTGANYLHLLPSDDLSGILSQIYAVPTTFFVNSQGVQVGSTIMAAQSKEAWIDTIDEMLVEVRA